MTLELLYLAACPNHEMTAELVCSVLEAEGMTSEVRQILIRNEDDARAHGFPGSPTIRVNGRDIEDLPTEQLAIGFACRTYLVEGRSQGIPPRSWLEQAVRAARKREDYS
jgi:hypothetical protein